jgi:hypothetical protein
MASRPPGRDATFRMVISLARRLTALCCIALCAGNALLPLASRASITVVSRDTDGDGRPDRWDYYDQAGRLARVIIDRDLDGRVDLVQDLAESSEVAVLADTDFDGTIDRLDVVREDGTRVSFDFSRAARAPSMRRALDPGSESLGTIGSRTTVCPDSHRFVSQIVSIPLARTVTVLRARFVARSERLRGPPVA